MRWAPRQAWWWTGVLFAAGSTCFFVAPFPGFQSLVGPGAVGVVFFAGSICFTVAALLQCLQVDGASRAVRLAALVQLGGTVLFNVDTFDAMRAGLDTTQEDRLVWAPDALGSACFLVASSLAYAAVRGHARRRERTTEWWIAALNLAGSVAFGVSAIASYVVPASGSILDLAAANFTTALGALGFLLGAVLLVRSGPA